MSRGGEAVGQGSANKVKALLKDFVMLGSTFGALQANASAIFFSLELETSML